MTREEILAIAKPILFNTDKVKVILANCKSVTRRVVKPHHLRVLDSPYRKNHPETPDKVLMEKLCEPPYRPGDILYVRETWTIWDGDYEYKADVDDGYGPFCSNCTLDICAGGCNSALKWRPSIHMPKEAARIFLRVTNVRVERLQEINGKGLLDEGLFSLDELRRGMMRDKFSAFESLWDSTLKKADRALYGWDANPWVWVIEFERVEAEK